MTAEPGGVLDRDQAREVLAPWLEDATDLGWQQVLDALAACVRPAAIDRDALVRLLHERLAQPWLDHWDDLEPYERKQSEWWVIADAILALVRPVEGVTLTPEEVARVGQWHTYAVRYMTQADDALAARLEAAQ